MKAQLKILGSIFDIPEEEMIVARKKAEAFIAMVLLRRVEGSESAGIALLPASHYQILDMPTLTLVGSYLYMFTYPTQELIEWLKEQIGGRKAIEINAGRGCIGGFLGIPTTDSGYCLQSEYQKFSLSVGIMPPIKLDCEVLNAKKAMSKYRPEVVISCWPLNTIDLPSVKDRAELILIGHDETHADLSIMKYEHETFKLPFLVQKGESEKGSVWIFKKGAKKIK